MEKMNKRNNLFRSFQAAFQGILSFFMTERNGKIHFITALFVITLSFVYNISPKEWIAVLLAIVMVFAAEMINTAIEKICDIITTDYHPTIKIIKDMCAGMVLFVAIFSVITGIIIFLPKILD